jgi:hypothetical protein
MHASSSKLARTVVAFVALGASSLAVRTAHADEATNAAVTPTPTKTDSAKGDAGKTLTVELVASSPHATIEKRVGTTSLPALPFSDTSFGSVSHWEHTCVAPCELKLDPHYAYRVAGDGLTPSQSFALPRDRDKVTVTAEMGSSTARLSGMVLTGFGVGSLGLGGTALLLSPVFENQDVGSKTFRSVVLAGGVVLVAAGVLELGAGLYLWLTNGTTVRADHGVLSAKADSGRVRVTPTGLVF